MKILYTSEYSGNNICGVYSRVKDEAEYMHSKGHEVFIFSTNINKSGGYLPDYEWMDESMHCFRFKPMFRLSENASWWAGGKFRETLLKIKPDIIICNTYRHLETSVCLDLSKKLGIPCVLVTHAPFLEPGIRGKVLSAATWLYDRLFCRINEFNGVFSISRWEKPYLEKLGLWLPPCYVPNALPDELFKKYNICSKNITPKTSILFLGRIAPIKDIPTLLKALELAETPYKLTLAGPFDKEYRDKLVMMMEVLGIQKQTCFTGSIDNMADKIELLDSNDIFVLPSLREGMPIALLEAMARGKIVISSRNQGAKEIISHGENGFLFEIRSPESLHMQLCQIESLTTKELQKISESAIRTAEQFKASKIYPETEKIYLSLISNERKKNVAI
jgi:glycosyltransferase involved in cell wall biosynthesis